MENFILLNKYWKKDIGVYILIAFVLTIYFSIEKLFCIELPIRVTLIILFVLGFIAVIIWLFSTNRLIMPSSKYTIVLFFCFDDEKAEDALDNVITKAVRRLNECYSFLRIKVYPYNKKNSNKEIERYYQRKFCFADIILFMQVRSGKESNEYKIQVKKHTCYGKFNIKDSLNIFKDDISIEKEFTLRNRYKDWVFLESNSFNDRSKITANLEDIISFYSAIYLLYEKEIYKAKTLLKDLFSQESNIITEDEIRSGSFLKDKYKVANARLGSILHNLYFVVAIKLYYEKNKEEAYKNLIECEKTFPNAINQLDRYILSARIAYECNDIENSKRFTDRLYIFNKGKFFYYLNYGFYAMLENNIHKVYENYSEIYKKANSICFNAIDVVDFLEQERSNIKNKDTEILIDFAQAFHTRLFIDNKMGDDMIDDFITKNENNTNLSLLCDLCKKVKMNMVKKNKHNNIAVNKNKRKKRRNRK